MGKIVSAAERGDLKKIKKYISKGVNLNKQQKWIEVDDKMFYDKTYEWFGNTALIEASQHGHIDIVRELLLNGADPAITACPKEDKHHTAIKAAVNASKHAQNEQEQNAFISIIAMLKDVNALWIKTNRHKISKFMVKD